MGIILLLGVGLIGIQAQDAVMVAGGDASGSGGSSSFSVGQVQFYCCTGTTGCSTIEGVQQPWEISVITVIDESSDLTYTCSVYPNPVSDNLNIVIENYHNESLSYHLYDMNGNLLESQRIMGDISTLSMSKYSPASYFLKISDKQKDIKVFKIIKK